MRRQCFGRRPSTAKTPKRVQQGVKGEGASRICFCGILAEPRQGSTAEANKVRADLGLALAHAVPQPTNSTSSPPSSCKDVTKTHARQRAASVFHEEHVAHTGVRGEDRTSPGHKIAQHCSQDDRAGGRGAVRARAHAHALGGQHPAPRSARRGVGARGEIMLRVAAGFPALAGDAAADWLRNFRAWDAQMSRGATLTCSTSCMKKYYIEKRTCVFTTPVSHAAPQSPCIQH